MNRADLIDTIAKSTGLPKVHTDAAVTAFVAAIADALKTGDKIAISGLGSFHAATRKARTGRNPATGAAIEITATTAVRFKVAKPLRDLLNPPATKNNVSAKAKKSASPAAKPRKSKEA